jgi:hypothetical protein
MPWTKEMHDTAQGRLNSIVQEYQTALAAWQNGAQSGNPAQYEAQVQDILRRWRQFTNDLRGQSEAATANQGVMDLLGQLVAEVGDQQQILARLRSEAGTREDQADSLNPKIRPSPYTNILGLQRTFRESTRTTIFWIAVVFGALALGGIGFIATTLLGPVFAKFRLTTPASPGTSFGVAKVLE